MVSPRSRIYLLDGTGFSEVKYEDTEHYAVTRELLNNPRRMLDILLTDGDEEDEDVEEEDEEESLPRPGHEAAPPAVQLVRPKIETFRPKIDMV
jgi:hypothetical protein